MKKKKSLKYINTNATISTNEFMQLFLLSINDYKPPSLCRDKVILYAEKNIDGKCNIRIDWELLHLMPDNIKKLILANENNILNYPVVKMYISELSVFTREEIMMYLILFNHYVENKDQLDENGNIVISIKEIHCKYRNKSLKMYSQIDKSTLKTYGRAIRLLSEKSISVNTEACKDKVSYIRKYEIPSFTDKLLNYVAIKNEEGTKLLAIKYNLGKFGNLLITSKRMTSKFPVELLEKPYKQIGQVFIGLYISKMLYINRNKRKFDGTLVLSIPTILNNIMYYDNKGKNTSQTLLKRLNNKNKQNYRLVKNFEISIKEVLELYKKHHFIQDYEIDDITVANYKLKSTKVKIIVK